jgi:hypothetical protein
MCEKNARYARDVAEKFRLGESPADFPKEDYETEWDNRFTESDLNEIGPADSASRVGPGRSNARRPSRPGRAEPRSGPASRGGLLRQVLDQLTGKR